LIFRKIEVISKLPELLENCYIRAVVYIEFLLANINLMSDLFIYRLEVGAQGLQSLIAVLRTDQTDSEIIRYEHTQTNREHAYLFCH
jgi:hypothetical protein